MSKNNNSWLRRVLGLILSLAFSVSIALAEGYRVRDVPNVLLADSLRLTSDPASFLTPEARQGLDEQLVSLRRTYGVEATVVVLPSIAEADVEDFATELFRLWGIGDKKDNTGLLILLVIDQRKIRMEVGYGLEGVLTDARCAQIQRRVMIPAMRRGDYATALEQGIRQVDELLRVDYLRPQRPSNEREDVDSFALIACYLVFVGLAFAWFTLEQQRMLSRASSPHGARLLLVEIERNFQNALWIFLLLCAPLALIIYVYRYRARRRLHRLVVRCTHCSSESVHLLSTQDRPRYLSSGDVAEETIGSTYHRVYLCPSCKTPDVVLDVNPSSPATLCPSCGYRTLVGKRPYRVGERLVRLEVTCLHCGHSDHKDRQLRDEAVGDDLLSGVILSGLWGAARSSGRGFGGGFSGGGFSGGSFGGGSSGGGGATSSW